MNVTDRLIDAGVRLARFPFQLVSRRPFVTPRKVLILKPCCVSQVLLTTPLLAVLSEAYPRARFDWAVSDWARPVVAANPRLSELIRAGAGGIRRAEWGEVKALIAAIREQGYDTCFIPSRSSLLAYVAWRAGIRQRIGLHVNGRGFAHTMAIRPPAGPVHEAELYLSLARALRLDPSLLATLGRVEFYPPDPDRTAVTARLVEQVDWLGEAPLAIVHPGGGVNPVLSTPEKRWPAARFALLANHLARRHGARVVLVGAAADRPLATAVAGMMSFPAANLAGQLGLGEVGALCELADLYVGNDAGPTHVAVATGCPTLAIFGPSDPAVSGPYAPRGRVRALWRPPAPGAGGPAAVEGPAAPPFSWADGVTVEEAIAAADALLAPPAAEAAEAETGATAAEVPASPEAAGGDAAAAPAAPGGEAT